MKLTKVQELLCLALSSDSEKNKKSRFIEIYNQVDRSELYKEAKQDEVLTHLAYLILNYKLDSNKDLEISLNEISFQMNIFLSELDKISFEFSKQNIEVVALKNLGILKGVYKNLYCSPMGDLDLLIKKTDFYLAHETITKKLGYKFKFRSKIEKEDIDEAYSNGGGEYYKVVDDIKVWVEIQWRPVAGRWIQKNSEPDSNQLICDSIAIENTKVKILSPVDNLLQVCLHTAKHSYCRAPGFRLHSDVDRIVRYCPMNWDVFLDKVRKLQIKTAVYFSLFFSKELLKTAIPDKVLEKLKPNIIKRTILLMFIRNAGIFNQNKKKFSRFGYILFNIMLFDSVKNLFDAIFPQITNLENTPTNFFDKYRFYYKRILDLIFKRENI